MRADLDAPRKQRHTITTRHGGQTRSRMQDHGQRRRAPAVIGDVREDDSDVYMIGIHEADAPNSWSLLFMEPYDAQDPQEAQLGMDTYCLVAGPGQATSYGGVQECELGSGRLRLALTAAAAATLGMPVDTSFTLKLTPQQIELLGRGLARVLTTGRADEVPPRLSIFPARPLWSARMVP
jgi:hypothetical protein